MSATEKLVALLTDAGIDVSRIPGELGALNEDGYTVLTPTVGRRSPVRERLDWPNETIAGEVRELAKAVGVWR